MPRWPSFLRSGRLFFSSAIAAGKAAFSCDCRALLGCELARALPAALGLPTDLGCGVAAERAEGLRVWVFLGFGHDLGSGPLMNRSGT